MARLRSDFWVSAYLRQRMSEAQSAQLARRGAAEAGAIFVRIDQLDGQVTLYGPALQSLDDDGVRRFRMIMSGTALEIEDQVGRELKFDSDIWIVDVEDPAGRPALDLAQD